MPFILLLFDLFEFILISKILISKYILVLKNRKLLMPSTTKFDILVMLRLLHLLLRLLIRIYELTIAAF